jgi:hypothetical protein
MFGYSTNEERYFGRYETREDALSAARTELSLAADDAPATVWTGRCVHAREFCKGMERGLGEDIANSIEERQLEEFGADDQMVELSEEQAAELGTLVLDWIEGHGCFAGYYTVADVESHRVEPPAVVTP